MSMDDVDDDKELVQNADQWQDRITTEQKENMTKSFKRRRKKKKKSKKKEPEKLDGVIIQEILNKKEEEWSRVCFVQKLRMQQTHHRELENIKKLWKQERVVNENKYTEIVTQKDALENELRTVKADFAKLENSVWLDQSVYEIKNKALNGENARIQKQSKKWLDAREEKIEILQRELAIKDQDAAQLKKDLAAKNEDLLDTHYLLKISEEKLKTALAEVVIKEEEMLRKVVYLEMQIGEMNTETEASNTTYQEKSQDAASVLDALKTENESLKEELNILKAQNEKLTKDILDMKMPCRIHREAPEKGLYLKTVHDREKRRELVRYVENGVGDGWEEIKQPELDQLSTLFRELNIKKYLKNFQKEEYLFEDLTDLSSECLEELIPKLGPRKRFKRWIVTHRPKKSSFSKQVLNSLSSKSNTKTKNLFTENFRSSLESLCNAHTGTKSALALVEEQKMYILELINNKKTDAQSKYEAFLSHVQKDSADLCRSLWFALEKENVGIWYDKEAERLDSKGIVNGIFYSSEFVFVMVRDYFERPYCIFELLLAVAFAKPITVVLETDRRFGGLAFEELTRVIPEFFYDHIKAHEIIKVNREYFKSFYEKLVRRIVRHRK